MRIEQQGSSYPTERSGETRTTGDDAMRAAFERHIGGEQPHRILFKRGGSVFAEHVPGEQYFDGGIQQRWEHWQAAWNAACADCRKQVSMEAVHEWAKRHDLTDSDGALREIFDDARTLREREAL